MVIVCASCFFFFFSSRRRHTRFDCDWSSDVCSSDLGAVAAARIRARGVQRDARGRGRAGSGAIPSRVSGRRSMVPRLKACGFPLVRTVDQVAIRAPPERVFQMASQVERWPRILPHYRWVRFLERREGGGIVEKAAWGPFGPLGYPTWWGSQMTIDVRAREIRY